MPISKPGPPEWGLCIRPKTSFWKKIIILRCWKTDAAIITGKYIARIIVGNKCYHALDHILKTRHVKHSLWVGLCETIIGPIVTYGGESWTRTNKMERALMAWEIKILCKICGTKYENSYCWIKMNQGIYNWFKSPDMVIVIKACTQNWLWHVVRMEDEMPVK